MVRGRLVEMVNAQAKPDDTILLGTLGHLGYRIDIRKIDRDGLVSPQVLHYYLEPADPQYAWARRFGGTPFIRMIGNFEPDFIAIGGEEENLALLTQYLSGKGYAVAGEFHSSGYGLSRTLRLVYNPNGSFFVLYHRVAA